MSQSDWRGVWGNNAIWLIPTSSRNAGNAYLFGYGSMECQTTGPFFTADEQTLFLSVQHPGEVNGLRKDGATGYEDRKISMRTPDNQEFVQTRRVPIGSTGPIKPPTHRQSLLLWRLLRQDAQPITTAKLS